MIPHSIFCHFCWCDFWSNYPPNSIIHEPWQNYTLDVSTLKMECSNADPFLFYSLSFQLSAQKRCAVFGGKSSNHQTYPWYSDMLCKTETIASIFFRKTPKKSWYLPVIPRLFATGIHAKCGNFPCMLSVDDVKILQTRFYAIFDSMIKLRTLHYWK